MLSILIPIYNVDVRVLVHDLLVQLRQLNATFEIILEDDASSREHLRIVNKSLASDVDVQYIQNETNVGRARVRNHLASQAKYPYVLFIDCDASMKRANYLSQYLQYIQAHRSLNKPFVVLGGVGYRDMMVESEYRLRWKYGVAREQVSAAMRNLHPYRSFTPFNVLLTRSVFDTCSFDESLSTYGFEDTLFGETLEQWRIPVEHIDNELYHDGIDTNEEYLSKVESAMNNLAKLYKEKRISPSFEHNFRLLRVYKKLIRWHLHQVVFALLHVISPLLRMFTIRFSSLFALDLYKLLFFMKKLN